MKATLSLKPTLRLSAKLVQGTYLLQMSGPELDATIERELAENPALELANEGDPLLRLGKLMERAAPSAGIDTARLSVSPTTLDALESDLRVLAPGEDLAIAMAILHALDDRGYLLIPTEVLVRQWGVSEDDFDRGLLLLRRLDVPGIGARDLRECLLLQCDYLIENGVDCGLAPRMIRAGWAEFVRQQWQALALALDVGLAEVEVARNFIARNLYPYPLATVDSSPVESTWTWSDLVISKEVSFGSKELHLRLPAQESAELRISSAFDQTGSAAAWAAAYVEQARHFIDLLNYRWRTIREIGEHLIAMQSDYLLGLVDQPKPLTRRSVSIALGLHESTVGRAIRGKTVQLPDGRIVSVSSFFGPSETRTSVETALCDASFAGLSDREVAETLNARGIRVARRTVAKYRQANRFDSRTRVRSTQSAKTSW